MRNFLGMLGLVILLSGCFDTTTNILAKEEKSLLDSLYSKKVAVLRTEIDSICAQRYEEMFAKAVDSIRLVRYQEINEMLENQ